MENLKQGSHGPQVTKLQKKLNDLGFDTKGIDQTFGSNTRNALVAFQTSKGLQADGIAGPRTLAALGLDFADVGIAAAASAAAGVAAARPPSATPNVTAALVSKMFPGTPVGNITANLPIVMHALADAGLADKDMVLMALATIRAETGSFEPISEGISHFNTSPGGHPFDKYDNRHDLGNQGPPDGDSFKGRGFIQLTGRDNYRQHGAAIGLGNQLIENPRLANQPDIAAKLLASFLKNKEQAIRNALRIGDLKTARKLVNGGSHGLDQFTTAFNIGKDLI